MKQLQDRFGRIHDYLRISLTGQCNMRCNYCVPHGDFAALKGGLEMKKEEFLSIAQVFVEWGIKKIRLTGGEPLLRKDFREIALGLAQKNVALAISTNGLLLHQYLDDLEKSGIQKVNISLDSLSAESFKNITESGKLSTVLNNMELCLKRGMEVKINAVALKGVNENELLKLASLTLDYPLSVRFIEFMPFFKNEWNLEKVFGLDEILLLLKKEFVLQKLKDGQHDTDKKYKIEGAKGNIGIISTITQPFCQGCNRLRLTADGKIKNCLFGTTELDLLSALRKGEDIAKIIQQSVAEKHQKTGGQNLLLGSENRSMISIGG
jgi:cyclic pyranopterin phosphate synthase